MKKSLIPPLSLKIDCSLVTFLTFLLAYFSGRLDAFLILYGITFVHELTHATAAFLFGVKTKNIQILPVGFCAVMEDFSFLPFWKQLVIYLSGPCMALPLFAFGKFLFVEEFISSTGYAQFCLINLSICLINLFPIEPLDGGNIFHCVTRIFLPEKKCQKISLLVSFLSLILLSFFFVKNQEYFIFTFLWLHWFYRLKVWKKQYRIYLLKRLQRKIALPEKVVTKPEIYHFKENYLWQDGDFLEEKEFIPTLLEKKK